MKRLIIILGLLLLIGCQVSTNLETQSQVETVETIPTQEIQIQNPPAVVTKIVDGDTIDINLSGDIERIRILGIDFPDVSSDRIGKWEEMGLSKERIVKCYKEGNDWMETMLNQEVILIADSGEDDKDRYNRSLRYVAWGNDDIGSLLIRQGYAVIYDPTKPQCVICEDYKQLEEQVRIEKNGCLWQE